MGQSTLAPCMIAIQAAWLVAPAVLPWKPVVLWGVLKYPELVFFWVSFWNTQNWYFLGIFLKYPEIGIFWIPGTGWFFDSDSLEIPGTSRFSDSDVFSSTRNRQFFENFKNCPTLVSSSSVGQFQFRFLVRFPGLPAGSKFWFFFSPNWNGNWEPM